MYANILNWWVWATSNYKNFSESLYFVKCVELDSCLSWIVTSKILHDMTIDFVKVLLMWLEVFLTYIQVLKVCWHGYLKLGISEFGVIGVGCKLGDNWRKFL